MTADDAIRELGALTPRERECLVYRCKGEGRVGIAQAMSIDIKTVDKHLEKVRSKLDMNLYAACWLVGKAGLG